MMKKIAMALVAVVLVGGFAFLAVTDVPVQKQTVVESIATDRFFNAH